MRCILISYLFGASLLWGQAPSDKTVDKSDKSDKSQPGIAAEWDARKQIQELNVKLSAVQPLLEGLDAEKWRAAEAPDAYLSQLDAAKRQLRSAVSALEELRQTPEKLSVALEIFLRLQALQNMLDATVEAARKYQSVESADQLQEKLSEIAPVRDRFQRYMLDLAGERDQQLEVLLKEAQRCRVEVNRPPAKK